MTTVITRLYADPQSARGIMERLYRQGFPRHEMTVVRPSDGDFGTLQAKMERALVPSDAAHVYAGRVAEGNSLVIVRAGYKPLNAVRLANETFETSGALSSGLEEESFRVQTPPDHAPSILKDHPRFLTMPPAGGDHIGGPLSDQLGFRLLSAQRRRDSVLHDGKRFFGDGIIRNRKADSVLHGGGFMSKFFWPMPLITKKKRGLSVIRGGGHPLSRLLGWPTIS